MQDLSESNRSVVGQEIMVFISSIAAKIQELNRILDDMMSESDEVTMHLQHYRLIITSLLNVRKFMNIQRFFPVLGYLIQNRYIL